MASAVDSGIETSNNSDDGLFIQKTEEDSLFVPEIPEKEKRLLTFHSELSATCNPSNSSNFLSLNAQHNLEVLRLTSNISPPKAPCFSKVLARNKYKLRLLPISVSLKRRKLRTLRGHSLGTLECHFYTRIRKLRFAIATNNTEMVERLLSLGAPVNKFNFFGQTFLHTASARGYTEIVSLLLMHGADPNYTDSEDNTPLHLAASSSHIKVVSLLLKAGANPLCRNIYGDTPLCKAKVNLSLIKCEHSDSDVSHNCKFKEEVQNIVNMLIVVLQKKKYANADKHIETLTALCSQLSLSNTSDELKKTVGTILTDSLNAMSIY